MTARGIVRILAILSALMFAWLSYVSKTQLEPEGLAIFDGRVQGYGKADALTYLAKLPEASRQLYLGRFRQVDTVFPVTLALTLAIAAWVQTRRGKVGIRLALWVLVALYLAADLTENARVSVILESGATLSEEYIWTTGLITQAKWAALIGVLLGFVSIWWGRRRSRSHDHD